MHKAVDQRLHTTAALKVVSDAWWQAILWLRTRDGRLWTAGKHPVL